MGSPLLALLTNIRVPLKILAKENTLAYLSRGSVKKKKNVISLAPWTRDSLLKWDGSLQLSSLY
jgi:hypothetical protein